MATEHVKGDPSSRKAVLGLVRSGLLKRALNAGSSSGGVATQGAPGTPVHIPRPESNLVDLFEEVLRDYRANVVRVDLLGLPEAVAEVVSSHGLRSLVVPNGLDKSWYHRVSNADVIVDDGSMAATEFESIDGVITGCSCAISETGTLVLSSQPDEGRRVLTLLPDYHICIVRTEVIVPRVKELFKRIGVSNPVTLISGPSATSDIELKRVEGVHGPRNLIVIIVE